MQRITAFIYIDEKDRIVDYQIVIGTLKQPDEFFDLPKFQTDPNADKVKQGFYIADRLQELVNRMFSRLPKTRPTF